MRDLLIIALVVVGSIYALRRPWVGVIVWTWLSIMNPHRYSWGPAYDAPLAALSAVATLLGLLFTRDKSSPLKGAPAVWFVCFMIWMTLSWLAGLDPAADYEQWIKVMKIDFMILVALALLKTKKEILALAWVVVGSLAVLGAKGGLFTVATGGSYKVWGPPGSYITGNNEFALALVATIPLLRFLQLQLRSTAGRHAMTLTMVLCAAAALGSHSRGALLGLIAMAVMLWWRGQNKLAGGVLIALISIALVAFMPENWTERMQTIETYQEDRSALGRLAAWSLAWNGAFHHPFGFGFNAARPELFLAYSSYGLEFGTPVAHSIYFQVLGHHGFVGLFLFLAIWISTYRMAGRLRIEAARTPESRWASELGAMCQVSLVGYAVGGAFLSLAYFDLPYNVLVLVVLGKDWLAQKGWEREPEPGARWWHRVPGLGPRMSPAATGSDATGALRGPSS